MKTSRSKNQRSKDLVRICKCGERLLCTIEPHGYIDVFTAKYNSYLFEIGYYHRAEKGSYYCTKPRGIVDFRVNGELFLKQTGISLEEIRDRLKEPSQVKKMVSKGELTVPNKEIRARLKTSFYNKNMDRPLYYCKSTCPQKITYVKCLNCSSKMMLKTFKELKGDNS